MKRFFCLLFVFCILFLSFIPSVYAFIPDGTEIILSLDDYFDSGYFEGDTYINEYSFSQSRMSFQFKNSYSLLPSLSHSFVNSTGDGVYNCGFYVPYLNPIDYGPYFNVFNGKEIFDFTSISPGSILTFEFPFSAGFSYSGLSYGNLSFMTRFYDSNFNLKHPTISYTIFDSSRNLSYTKNSGTINDRWNAGSYSGVYSVSFAWPENISYFTFGFGLSIVLAENGAEYSFSASDCTLKVAGVPYPTQPTISYNWSDTGAAKYPLGTTTGVPLQVHVTNTQSYGSYSYQWYSGQFNKYDADHLYGYGTPIEGATSAVYMPPVDHLGTYWYYCVVGHTSGDNMAYTHTSDCLVTVVDPSTGGSGVDPTEPSDPSGGGGGTGTDPGGGSTDPTVPSSGGDSGGDTGGDSGGGSSDPTVSNDDVVAGIEESNNWLENIANGILSLPQTIMNGIKGLFIPDQAAMETYADKWDDLLADRFGVVWESLTFVSDIVSVAYSPLTTIEVPSVTVNLAGTDFTFGGWVVDIIPDGFEFLSSYSKLAVNFIATLAFFNGMKKRLYDVMGIDFKSDAASYSSYKKHRDNGGS